MRDMAAKPNPEPELRAALWQAAESVAVARDERPARKVEIALLRDLTYEQNKACVRAFVEEQFTGKGLVADVSIHLKKEASDGKENLHAHILLSARTITTQGNFSNRKHPYWDSRERVKEMRKAWADTLNRFCEQYGVEVRTDHRSYSERGIDREPGTHLGPEQWHMEERGVETAKGEANREIRQNNQLRDSVRNYELDEAQPALSGDLDAGLVTSSRSEQQQSSGDGTNQWRAGQATATHQLVSDWLATGAPEALSDSKLDALHRDRLSLSMTGRVRRSVRSMVEGMSRLRDYGRTMLAKTRDLTGSVFDRYATSVMRRMPQGRQREREAPER
jgi:ATP-dependent exoDNAse (exonuclease V) alpha subunit